MGLKQALKLAAWMALGLLLSSCGLRYQAQTPPALTALPPATATAAAVDVASPTIQPTPGPQTAVAVIPSPRPDISYNGISFDYPIALATAVEPQTIVPDPDGAPALPAFERFLFVDYPASGGSQPARLEIYLAQPFADLNLDARAEIGRLRRLLEERPPLDMQSPLPFLPLLPEMPQEMGVADYLDFPAGAGVRYVTQLEPALPNAPLVYTFQGLSADGKRYISAIFPLKTPGAAESWLDGLASGQFEPDLLLFDSLIRSLSLPTEGDEPAAQGLMITQPAPGALEVAGEKVALAGSAPSGVDAVGVRLEVGGLRLMESTSPVDGEQRWQLTLPIPAGVAGPVRLVVTAGEAQVSQPLQVVPTAEGIQPAFELYQPLAAEVAVAGYPLFFSGSLLEPADGTLRLAVLVNDCQDQIAEQPVVLGAFGGEWNGYLLLPERVTGPACAIAYTGSAADDTLRLQVRPLEIVAESAEGTPRLSVGFSERSYFKAGETGLFFGGAVGAGAAGVGVQLLAADGTILAQQATAVENGVWQVTFQLPVDIDPNPRLRITLLDEPEVTIEQTINIVN